MKFLKDIRTVLASVNELQSSLAYLADHSVLFKLIFVQQSLMRALVWEHGMVCPTAG